LASVHRAAFKDTVSRNFCFWFFFHESVSPQPQSIPLKPFQIFSKINRDICKSRCTTSINDTGGKFANDTGGHIATGIKDTGGKIAAVSTTPAAFLPPVSTTLAANFATRFASVVDSGGKFAISVNDTGGK
jgi:hypothetical protein